MNFSRRAWSSGWSFAMRFAEREAARVKGTKMILRVSVVSTMAQPQPHVLPDMRLWIQVISVRRIWLKNLKKPNCMTLSWSARKTSELARRRYSFGPT